MEPLYCGHHWAKKTGPDYRGVLVSFQRLICTQKYTIGNGTTEAVLIREVSLLQRYLLSSTVFSMAMHSSVH